MEYPGGDNVHSRCRRGRAAALPRCLGLSGALPGRRRDVPGAFAEHHAGIHPGRPRDGRGAADLLYPPYDIPQPGSLTIYTYLGKCGSDFYFRADQCDDEYAFVSQSVLRIGTDGTRTDLGITKTPDYLDYCAVLQGDEVRWFLTRGTDGIYLIYDTQGHEIGRNERPAGLEAFFPLCMLDDGRLLMVVGYDWEHDSAARYAVMDADEFLTAGRHTAR